MANQQKSQSPVANLEPNAAGALSYLIPPITGIALYVVEKENKFVRFHAFQSILFGVVLYALWTIVGSLRPFIIGGILAPFVSLGGFGLWLYLMWEAYNNREYELPYLGKIAKDQINK
ncbi:hypothetical protein OAL67_00040 [bacterium]|nr:hypothetical protein [bacterium]